MDTKKEYEASVLEIKGASAARGISRYSIQRFYTGLENAFDSLQMKIRGQPDLG